MVLDRKKVLLGISGSISAYKGCEVVRELQRKGAEVRVTLTPSAEQFIGRLTFKALTEYDVLTGWMDGETGLEHITWARWSDAFVIAPASANTIAKIRYGIADNFLTSVALAYDKPLVIAPAMNTKMYENPATVENIKILKERGHIFVEPEEGILACGEEGKGRLAEPESIVTAVMHSVFPKPLKNKKVVVTAGGTREFLDPIRYISNASSGQLGYELAKFSYVLGGDVTLISAPTCLKTPYGVKRINVTSAEDMLRETLKEFENADILIMNAAVADFSPKEYSSKKLKKKEEEPIIHLKRNKDILLEVGKRKKSNQIIVGFAAESENLIQNAEDKLRRKNLDVIVGNYLDVFSKGKHRGIILFNNGEILEIPEMTKEESAFYILKNLFLKNHEG
ncbi:bifunctional phosphopantothenoylcysteine decarboxylase/phosphopantothenate--cysteine ligase CoaBC [Persephonella sp.]